MPAEQQTGIIWRTTSAAASTAAVTSPTTAVTSAANVTSSMSAAAETVFTTSASAEKASSVVTTTEAEIMSETAQTAAAASATETTEAKQTDIIAFTRFSDYTDWAATTGYTSGLLCADGTSGLNQDYFHTPDNTDSYCSGCIVIGDSRCCQLGIYQERTGRSNLAVFAVWGGHYVSGYGGIMTEQHFADVEKCFQKQIEVCGECTIFFFATVNDYDCWNNNNSYYISSAVSTAERLASLRYEMNGKEYSPEIVVIGFDGCRTTGDLFGTPHETFNRYVAEYNEALRDVVSASPILQSGITRFSTVPSIAGGKADFIDDGLHYSDTTLEDLTAFITGG